MNNLLFDFKFILCSLIIITFFCCNQKEEPKGKRELVPNPEKYAHDDYLQTPDSLKPIFKPDTVIGKVSLINPLNVKEYFGEDVMERLIDTGLPNSSIVSKDQKQRLKFYFHPGNGKYDFSEFKILYNSEKFKNETIVNDKEFITESGIKLGMTVGELRALKGEPVNITKNKTIKFHYYINDYKNSDFLKKYNMPIYYSNYVFNNGYLIEFSFGFEYP